MREIKDPVFRRILDKFEDGTFTMGNECPLRKYYFENRDIYSFRWEERTPEVCASLMDYSKCRLADVPEASRTREFYMETFSNKDVNNYIKNHISEFDRQFFKDLIVTNKYSTHFDTNCFNVMPLEYIDDEMVSLAILHTQDWASDEWLFSVVKRKKEAISADVWKLAARLYARMSGGVNRIMDATPLEYRDDEYYKETMRCNFNCGMSLDTNKGNIMDSIPQEVITSKFLVSLLNEDLKTVARFNEAALEMEVPFNDNGEIKTDKVWKVVVKLDGQLIEYIPLNDERVEYFLSLYAKDTPEYKWGFKRVYKDWLKKKNAPQELENVKRRDRESVFGAAEETFMHALLFSMEGEDPGKAIDLVADKDRKANASMLPIRFHGMVPTAYAKEYDSEEYLAFIYKTMGINIVEEYDSYFYSVELPEGWTVTGDRYWYKVLDKDGNEMIQYFYDSKFYDKDAYVSDITLPEEILIKTLQ